MLIGHPQEPLSARLKGRISYSAESGPTGVPLAWELLRPDLRPLGSSSALKSKWLPSTAALHCPVLALASSLCR